MNLNPIRGGHCWFSNPRALYDAAHDRTWMQTVGPKGHVSAIQYDRSFGTVTVKPLKQFSPPDDHDNASFVQFPDGRIAIFYGHHQAQEFYYRVSDVNGDLNTLGPEIVINLAALGLGACHSFSYFNPMFVTGGNRLMLLFRQNYADHNRWIAISNYNTLASNTWSGYPLWEVPGRDPYLIARSNGVNRIDFLCTSCHPATDVASAYHFYFFFDGTNAYFRKSDGTNMRSLATPYGPADATQIVSGPSVGNLWIQDIALGADGKPRVLFDTYPSNDPSNNRRMYGRWTGTSWATTEICDGGESLCPSSSADAAQRYYTGGSCFDGNDRNQVILGRSVAGSTMEIWDTADDGATWCVDRVLAGPDDHLKLFRPVSPAGYAPGSLSAFWWRGAYDDYYTLDALLQAYGTPDQVALIEACIDVESDEAASASAKSVAKALRTAAL
jgi:hypothetical protein